MKKYSVHFLLLFFICFAIVAIGINFQTKTQQVKLNTFLKQYETIKKEGGWSYIKTEKSLKKGMCYPEIKTIKKRLSLTGEFADKIKNPTDSFDIKLEKAVIAFQRNHNLKPNGLIDKKTLHELNIGIDHRIRQIKINMKKY